MKKPRRAFTLVELLTAMSIFSVIFATVILTLHALFRTSSGLSDGVAAAVQQQRFAAELRHDAHESLSATLSSPEGPDGVATVLNLSLAEGQDVEYRLYPHRIERRLRAADAVTHADSYGASPVLDQGWKLYGDRSTPLLEVLLRHDATAVIQGRDSLPPVQVRAALRIVCAPDGSITPEG